jgi:hypothetical protein
MQIKRIVAVGLMSAMLVGCGSAALGLPTATPAPAKPAAPAAAPTSAAAAAKPAEPPRPAAAMKPAAAAPAAGGAMTVAREADSYAAAPGAAPQPAPAAAYPSANVAKSELAQSTVPTDVAWLDRKIIRNATLSIWSENVERSVQVARQVAETNGGFISGSNTRTDRVKIGEKDEDRQIATLTVQVPAQQFDRTIDALRQLGKVESEVGTSQDVTEEFVDLSANVQNLRKTEEAIQSMLGKATQLNDVMTLTRELTQIRGQIERLEGRKRFLEKRSDLSIVTLTVQPPPIVATPVPTATPTPIWDPSRTAERGWNASLRVLRGIAEVGILAIAFGWWLIPVAGVIGVVALRMRRPTRSPETAV